MFKKLLSASIIYALAPQIPKLVSLLMMPLITKYMTPTDYGVSGILMAYLAAFEAFNDLGIRVNLTNSFFKYPNRFQWIWRKLHGFIQLWSILYGIVLLGVLAIVIPDLARENFAFIALLLIIPISLFNPVSNLGKTYYQYAKKPIPISIISATAGIITVFANYYFIVGLKWGYLGLFAGQFISGLFSFIVYLVIVYWKINLKPDYSFSFAWIKKKLKVAMPTIPHYYAGYIINISDRVLLDWFNVPIQQIGLYSFAYSFGTYFSIIGKSFMQASGPYYMENLKKENKEGEMSNSQITKYTQIGLLGLALLLAIWLKNIFGLLVKNDELASAYLYTIVIIFSYTYFPSYAQVSMKLWYLEKTKLLMKITVSAAVISIALNIILIPAIGIWGSVIATFFSMMAIGYGGYLVPEIKMNIRNYRWGIMLGITIFALIISFTFIETAFYLKAIVTLGCILAIFYLYKIRK